MKKSIVPIAILALTLALTSCSKEVKPHEKVTVEKGQIAPSITIGSQIGELKLNDQFDKIHTIKEDTKKVIFVFTKATGHLVKAYFNTKDVDYLEKNAIQFVADVSPMPKVILEYIALKDLKKHKYPIMLIRDEKISPNFKNSENNEAIMIVNLDKLKVTGVKFVSNVEDFKSEIE
jgi:hypothetical protein